MVSNWQFATLDQRLHYHGLFPISFCPLNFYWRVVISLESSLSSLFNQCTCTTYFLWKEDTCLGQQRNFSTFFNPFTNTQKQTFTFNHFKDGRHFQDGCNEETSCVFVFPFLRWPFSSTEPNNTDIGLSEYIFRNVYMKYGIFLMHLHYFCLHRYWISFHQVMLSHQFLSKLNSLLHWLCGYHEPTSCVFYFLFFIDLFLTQFCKVCLSALEGEYRNSQRPSFPPSEKKVVSQPQFF